MQDNGALELATEMGISCHQMGLSTVGISTMANSTVTDNTHGQSKNQRPFLKSLSATATLANGNWDSCMDVENSSTLRVKSISQTFATACSTSQTASSSIRLTPRLKLMPSQKELSRERRKRMPRPRSNLNIVQSREWLELDNTDPL